MEQIPGFIYLIFFLTTAATIFLFLKAAQFSKILFVVLLFWLIAQYFIAHSGFYLETNILPPRFALTIVPPVLLIVIMFLPKKGKEFIDRLDLRTLTILHIIRIPVEIVLLWLSIYKTIPGLMSFEGRNWDILSGITAPLIYFIVFRLKLAGRKFLLAWNFLCLALLINIVILAILSAPFPFQRLAFDQPNIAVLYEPFIWLPCCIVPIVLFSHLASIRQILMSTERKAIEENKLVYSAEKI